MADRARMPPSTLATSNGSARGGGTTALVVEPGVDVGEAGAEDAEAEDSLVVDVAAVDARVDGGVDAEVDGEVEPASDGLVHADVVSRTAATSRRTGRGRIIHANPTTRWITGARCRDPPRCSGERAPTRRG